MLDIQAVGARAVLSAIAGSMITVAGVTFSMTIVTVSYASSQFGPRLIGNFLRDRGNQLTLGIFISTFVYCLMTLRTVRDTVGDNSEFTAFVPHISVLIALVLALLCVGFLIYFFHHIPESINIGNLIAKVAGDLDREVDELADEHRYPEAGIALLAVAEHEASLAEGQPCCLPSDSTGYLRTIDTDTLVRLACDNNMVLTLRCRQGDFVVAGQSLLEANSDTMMADDTVSQLKKCFAFGQKRSAHQDCMFLVDQLIEIIGRAMSPGVNDPFTAIACLNWIMPIVVKFSNGSQPTALHFDAQSQLRVIARAITFEELAHSVFARSAQYIATDRNTAMHTLEMIAFAGKAVRDREHRRILLNHASRLLRSVQQVLPLEEDQQDFTARYKAVVADLTT